ncbi:MAG: glycosyltransferase [Acidimicrobiales bacterium]
MTDSGTSFEHLLRLSDDTGVFEHALGAVPRRECGYCVDDVARALIVIVREPRPDRAVAELGERCLAFLVHAQDPDGRFHNRLGYGRRWEDDAGTGDWWGRAVWALGTVAARHDQRWARDVARICFDRSATGRSSYPRTMAFAALGAAEVAAADPGDRAARRLLAAAGAVIGRPSDDPRWPWPEPRLTYANAVIPEALIAAGSVLEDDGLLRDGLALLDWLLGVETGDGHLSPTAVGGWGAGETRTVFDQQPIEAAALADACARALAVTGDPRWGTGIDLAVGWFLGDNDAGVPLLDVTTGGGCDGLTAAGCNTNQGAESTLALISTMQQSATSRCSAWR